MRLRALPLLAGVVLALVPGVASAAPATAPVQNAFGETRIAQAQVELPDGRPATVWLAQYDGAVKDQVWSELYVEVACESMGACLEGGVGMVDLAGGQVQFSRGLGTASVTDIHMTLYTWDDRHSQNQVERQVTISARFEGTGTVSRGAVHGNLCWAMGATCQSVAVEASRTALGSLTVDGLTGTGSGSLAYGKYLSVGAPR